MSATCRSPLSHPCVIYIIKDCKFCEDTQALFAKLHIEPKIIDVDIFDSSLRVQLEIATGKTTMPQVFIAGVCVGGYEAIMTAYNNDTLVPLLKRAGLDPRETSEPSGSC